MHYTSHDLSESDGSFGLVSAMAWMLYTPKDSPTERDKTVIIVVMEIFKAPTPRLGALNKQFKPLLFSDTS